MGRWGPAAHRPRGRADGGGLPGGRDWEVGDTCAAPPGEVDAFLQAQGLASAAETEGIAHWVWTRCPLGSSAPTPPSQAALLQAVQ